MSKWNDDKVYGFGKYSVHTTRGNENGGRKWYLELHKDGHYWESRGSDLPFRWLAAWTVLLRKKAGVSDD